jgi:hypothetical protein
MCILCKFIAQTRLVMTIKISLNYNLTVKNDVSIQSSEHNSHPIKPQIPQQKMITNQPTNLEVTNKHVSITETDETCSKVRIS